MTSERQASTLHRFLPLSDSREIRPVPHSRARELADVSA